MDRLEIIDQEEIDKQVIDENIKLRLDNQSMKKRIDKLVKENDLLQNKLKKKVLRDFFAVIGIAFITIIFTGWIVELILKTFF